MFFLINWHKSPELIQNSRLGLCPNGKRLETAAVGHRLLWPVNNYT